MATAGWVIPSTWATSAVDSESETRAARASSSRDRVAARAAVTWAALGVGTSGGFTFVLEDRAGKDVQFLANNLGTFMAAARKRPEIGGLVSLALLLGLVIPDPQLGKTVAGLQPILALDTATREGDRLVGPFSALWYLAFVVPLFLFTPDHPAKGRCSNVENAGFAKLASLVKDLVRNHTQIALFLAARMLYADGLGAVFAFGGIYASTVFGWGATELGLFGLVLIVAGTFGAVLGGVLDDSRGSKWVIVATLVLFIAGSIGVLSVDEGHVLFVVPVAPKLPSSAAFSSIGEQAYLAFGILIGVASGPIQASSRTILARMCPPDKITEFFGFFSFSGKITAFAAPLTIGTVTALTGSQRLGIASSLIFMIAGLLLLLKVKER